MNHCPLLLDEQQRMLQESVRHFLNAEAPIAHFRHVRDSAPPQGLSHELWQQFVNLGLAGLLADELSGGSGLGMVEACVVMEQLGRTLTPSPFFCSAVVATAALSGNRDEEAQHLLQEMVAGRLIATLAIEEQSKHDPNHLTTRASRELDGYRIDGFKCSVVNGQAADVFLVLARCEESDAVLLAVPLATPGVRMEAAALVDGHSVARLVFEGAWLPASARMAAVDAASLQLILDRARVAVAAELVGVASEAFERTLSYLKERVQFGQAIGAFQALQHRSARALAGIRIAQASVLKAAQALDHRADNAGLLCAIAKAKAGSVATWVTQEAVQMHGGMGMTDEMDIGLFLKRARVLQEFYGDSDFHTDQVARHLGY